MSNPKFNLKIEMLNLDLPYSKSLNRGGGGITFGMIPDIVQLFHPNKLAENQLERKVSLLVKDEYSKTTSAEICAM